MPMVHRDTQHRKSDNSITPGIRSTPIRALPARPNARLAGANAALRIMILRTFTLPVP